MLQGDDCSNRERHDAERREQSAAYQLRPHLFTEVLRSRVPYYHVLMAGICYDLSLVRVNDFLPMGRYSTHHIVRGLCSSSKEEKPPACKGGLDINLGNSPSTRS